MRHNYFVYKRGTTTVMDLGEDAVKTLLFNREIKHVKSSHVGRDDYMIHYFDWT